MRIPYSEKTLQNYKPGLKGSTYTGDVKINEKGKIPEDYWDISIASKSLKENLNYPTQKPEKLLERIYFIEFRILHYTREIEIFQYFKR